MRILEVKSAYPEILKHKNKFAFEEPRDFRIINDGLYRFQDRIWVLSDLELRFEVLKEAHAFKLSIHPISTKMYRDFSCHFWWPGMKKDTIEFVSQCLTCPTIKAEHQRPSGLLQDLPILK